MPGLSAAQLAQFDRDGYLVVENVLDPRLDIEPLFAEYTAVLDGIVDDLIAEGVLGSRYDDLPFTDRLIRVCMESLQI
jgi:hypothetical protein